MHWILKLSFSMPELLILLKKTIQDYLVYPLINNMLVWCLYLLFAFIMGSVMLLCSSVISRFSFICRLSVTVLKKLFSSSDTKCPSDIIFSFSSTKAILFLIFLFSENKGCIILQKNLLSETFFGFILLNMLCAPFYITYYNSFFVLLYFFKELGVLFLKYNFTKYDLLIIAFLSAFATYGARFARNNVFFRGACSFKIDRNIISEKA